jgi:hypothetical protein
MLNVVTTLLQQASDTPDTVSYLILGYVIIGGVGLGYIVTMILRQRSLMRDLEVMEKIQNDED